MPLFYLSVLSAALLTIVLNETLEADKPTPPQSPYAPPFTGGQCEQNYFIELKCNHSDGNTYYFLWVGQNSSLRASLSPNPATFVSDPVLGSIRDVSIVYSNPSTGITQLRIDTSWGYVLKQFAHHPQAGYSISSCSINKVRLANGLPDNCGDIPNPNPPLDTISNNGYGVPPSNLDNQASLLYAPLIPIGGNIAGALAALSAALAALNAALTLAELAAALADVLDKLKDLGDEKDKEKEKEDEKKKRKEIWRQRLGTIRNDGILSLVPKDTSESIKLLWLEVNFVNIPNTIGKYFGQNSPNRYPYGFGLGYISFYGAGAGIIETHNMEFRRNSLHIPDGTYGFNYHLGLNTSTSATVDLVYEREVP